MVFHGLNETLNWTANSSRIELSFLSKLSDAEDLTLAALLIVSGILAIAMNGTVLLVAYYSRKLVKLPEYFILTVSLADLAMTITMYPMVIPALLLHRWPWGKNGCIFYGFSGAFFSYVAMLSLTMLSVMRYIHVRANVTGYRPSRRDVLRCIAGIIVYSLVWALAPVAGVVEYGPEPHGTSCSIVWNSQRPFYTAFILVLFVMVFFLPLVAMATSYGLIYFDVRGIVSDTSTTQRHLIKMTFMMCSSFLMAWLPYAVFSLWMTTQPAGEMNAPPMVAALPALFAKILSVNNVLIYAVSSRRFRLQASRMLPCWRRKVAPTIARIPEPQLPAFPSRHLTCWVSEPREIIINPFLRLPTV